MKPHQARDATMPILFILFSQVNHKFQYTRGSPSEIFVVSTRVTAVLKVNEQ
jgi:hypothetical protein